MNINDMTEEQRERMQEARRLAGTEHNPIKRALKRGNSLPFAILAKCGECMLHRRAHRTRMESQR